MANTQVGDAKANPPGNIAEVHRLRAPAKDHKGRTPQMRRRFWTNISFIPFVVLPVMLAILYYTLVAADRYAVETKFAIRSPSGPVATDLLGMVTGVSGSASTITDSYIIMDFIRSRELIDKIEKKVDIQKIYAHKNADFLAKLAPDSTKEELVEYLSSMISVYFDTSSQIITLEVQAFTPADAKDMSAVILQLCEALVNNISEKARNDTVQSAQREVDRAEDRLREHRQNVAQFREKQQDIDPTKTVESQQTLLTTVQGQLNTAKARMSTLREFLKADAPQVRVLKSRIDALEAQVKEEKALLGKGDRIGTLDSTTLTSRVGEYEGLAVDLEFLQRAYVSALASLERARAEADRQQRYLAAFVNPTVPEEALYPQRILNIFIVLILAIMGWGITLMMVYIVREHAT